MEEIARTRLGTAELPDAIHELRSVNRMLSTLTEIHARFVLDTNDEDMEDASFKSSFDALLEALLLLTDSDYGFIGEVLSDESGVPYLRTHALTNIAWDTTTRDFYETNRAKGLEFRNLDTLFGKVMDSGDVVIANDAPTDPRRGGIPHGHPPLHSFLGIPIYQSGQLVGMAGAANRPGGYDERLVSYLEPFTTTCGTLIVGTRLTRQRITAENALAKNEVALRYALELEQRARLDAEDANTQSLTHLGRLTSLITSMPAGVIVEDENGVVVLANDNFCEIFEVPLNPTELVGCHCEQFIPSATELVEDSATFGHRVAEILEARQRVLSEEIRFRNGRVTERDYLPIHSDDLYRGCLWVYHDVTHRRAQELEREHLLHETQRMRNEAEISRESLAQRNKLLRELDRAKDELIASVSHELRTPLTAITGFADVLLRTPDLPAEALEYATIIARNSERLAVLVDDLLVLKGVGAASLKLNVQPVCLEKAVRESIESIRPLAEQQKLTLEMTIDTVPAIMADEVRIHQMLNNLLTNAVKFTPEGGRISIALANQGRNVTIVVTDSGVGIPHDEIARLFDTFYRASNVKDSRFGGTGLGLSIVQAIVALHQGSIDVKSVLGAGTTITVSLPTTIDLSKSHSYGY
jgi:signal transduction histidine kinase